MFSMALKGPTFKRKEEKEFKILHKLSMVITQRNLTKLISNSFY